MQCNHKPADNWCSENFFQITPEQRQRANEHAAACVKETGVAPETAQKLSAGDFSQNDEKTQCFAKCFMEKAGFFDGQGHLNEDVIVTKLGKGADETKVTDFSYLSLTPFCGFVSKVK